MITVGIATLPSRQTNLLHLLDDLAEQSRCPDHVALFLNGWSATERDTFLSTLSQTTRPYTWSYDHSETLRGAGVRWYYFSSLTGSPDDLGVVLDDDFRINYRFLALTIPALLEKPEIGMVSWCGHERYRRNRYHGLVNVPKAVELQIAGAGTSVFRLAAVAGVATHPLAAELLGLGGDDETLVSLWLWLHGWQIFRPKGKPPVTSVDELQYAPTASHVLHGATWTARRDSIKKDYDWV